MPESAPPQASLALRTDTGGREPRIASGENTHATHAPPRRVTCPNEGPGLLSGNRKWRRAGDRFPTTAAGLTAVLVGGREQAVPPVVCEATGGYERLGVHRVWGTKGSVGGPPPKGWAVARAVGQGVKPDSRDAQSLAHAGEGVDLPCRKGGRGGSKNPVSGIWPGWTKSGRTGKRHTRKPSQPRRHEPNGRPCIRVCGALDPPGGHLAGVGAGIGPGGGEGADGFGRQGAGGAGPWAPSGLSGDSWRGARAAGHLDGGLVGDPHEHGPGVVLSAGPATREAGESGAGGREAEAAVAVACRGAAGDPVGRRRGVGVLTKKG